MKVAYGAVEERATDAGEDRVADVAMQDGHRPRCDAASKAVPHHEFNARAKPLDERLERGEVVTVVRVSHDHIPTAGRVDASGERSAVAALRHGHQTCPVLRGDLLTSIGTTVVRDDDFAADAAARQIA